MKYFKSGNVCVCGLCGRGKDMLFANIILRRKLPYVSNTNYGGQWNKFVPKDFDCGGNTYKNFLNGDLVPYSYPFDDKVDIYISDCGVYFPSQYCSELNKNYGYFATFMALIRHLGDCNLHFNVQNLNRVWDKIREQSDIYLMCNWCKVIFGKIVIQKVTAYEFYESAVRRVPKFRLPKPFISPSRRFQWRMAKLNYDVQHGSIRPHLLIYWNRSKYNTRIFKEVLAGDPEVSET